MTGDFPAGDAVAQFIRKGNDEVALRIMEKIDRMSGTVKN
jgi:hypothetical protein